MTPTRTRRVLVVADTPAGTGIVLSRLRERITAYSPDEERDDHGRWTKGDESLDEAYQLYSPNEKENLDFDTAVNNLDSDDQARFVKISQDVDSQVDDLKAQPHNAVGDWADGAENSIFNEIHGGTYEDIRYSAAVKGNIANQKAVIPFKVQTGGPDSVYKIPLSVGIREAREALSKAGIEYRTLLPEKAGTTVVVYDPGSKLRDKINDFAEGNNVKASQYRGRGEFLGGDTREEGHTAYRKVISEYEITHQRHYRGQSGSVVSASRNGVTKVQIGQAAILHRLCERISAGGPGSGCHGDNCGRPPKTYTLPTGVGPNVVKQFPAHDSWFRHPNWRQHAYGGVLVNNRGQFLLREPSHHFDGYSWTWPKGKLDNKNEHPADAAKREVGEETGHAVAFLNHIPGTYASGSGSLSNFYLMRSKGEGAVEPDRETHATKWATYDEAKDLIGQSQNEGGKLRDLAILDRANKVYQHYKNPAPGIEAAEFDEALHPRDPAGKFTDSGNPEPGKYLSGYLSGLAHKALLKNGWTYTGQTEGGVHQHYAHPTQGEMHLHYNKPISYQHISPLGTKIGKLGPNSVGLKKYLKETKLGEANKKMDWPVGGKPAEFQKPNGMPDAFTHPETDEKMSWDSKHNGYSSDKGYFVSIDKADELLDTPISHEKLERPSDFDKPVTVKQETGVSTPENPIPPKPEWEPTVPVRQPKQEFTYKGDASSLGGAHEKYLFTDKQGNDWLFKPATTLSGQPSPITAYAEEAASKIQQLVRPDAYVEVKTATLSVPGKGDQFGSIQKMVPNIGAGVKKTKDFANTDVGSISSNAIAQLQKEQVVDWLISNHDSHGGQFLRTGDGKVLGIDKAQAFKYFPEDQLSTSYHPNAKYGEKPPVYNDLLTKNTSDLIDPKTIEPEINRAMAIPDSEYRKILTPYAEARKALTGESVGHFINDALERKDHLKSDFETLYSGVLGKDVKLDTAKPAKVLDKGAAGPPDGMPSKVSDSTTQYVWDHMSQTYAPPYDSSATDLSVAQVKEHLGTGALVPTSTPRPKSEFEQPTTKSTGWATQPFPPHGLPYTISTPEKGNLDWSVASGSWKNSKGEEIKAPDEPGQVAAWKQWHNVFPGSNSTSTNPQSSAFAPPGMPHTYKGPKSGTYTWDGTKQKYAHGSNEKFDKTPAQIKKWMDKGLGKAIGPVSKPSSESVTPKAAPVVPVASTPKPESDKISQATHDVLESQGYKFKKLGDKSQMPLYVNDDGKAVYVNGDKYEFYPMGTHGQNPYGSSKGEGLGSLVKTLAEPFEKPTTAPAPKSTYTPSYTTGYGKFEGVTESKPYSGYGPEASADGKDPKTFVKSSTKYTSSEIETVSHYKGTSGTINAKAMELQAADAKTGGSKYHDYVAHMDSAIAKGRLNQDVTLYRGVSGSYADKLIAKFIAAQSTPADSIERNHIPYSFQETSLAQSTAHGFAGGVGGLVFKINAKKGFPAVATTALTQSYASEKGIILPRDTEYHMNKLYSSGGHLYAEVDVFHKMAEKAMAASKSMSVKELVALVGAAVRLGFTPDDLDCALGEMGGGTTPVEWRLLRLRLDQEVRRYNESK